MKCTACQVEISDGLKMHYLSDIHKVNAKLQIRGMPPVSEIVEETETFEVKKAKPKKLRTKATPKCLLCENVESEEHYRSHGLKHNEIECVFKMVCYVCEERFSTKSEYKMHIINGIHRDVNVTEKTLVLSSGVVLIREENRLADNSASQRARCREQLVLVRNEAADKITNARSKEQLKHSLQMNMQKYFRKDFTKG